MLILLQKVQFMLTLYQNVPIQLVKSTAVQIPRQEWISKSNSYQQKSNFKELVEFIRSARKLPALAEICLVKRETRPHHNTHN